MFGWFKKKEDVASLDSYEERERQAYHFDEKKEANCLYHKVLKNVKYDFNKWIYKTDGSYLQLYTNTSSDTQITIRSDWINDACARYYKGWIGTEENPRMFEINHASCSAFFSLWDGMMDSKEEESRTELLKKWDCK